jgi:tetrahydromethanopterin S-methyltransferase subunit G
MQKIQNSMEQFATQNLPAYAKILADNAEQTSKMMMTAVGLAAEGITEAMERLGKIKDKVEGAGLGDKGNGALVGAGAGALTGAAIGSVIPVVGTAVGAAVGGLIGGAAGWFAGGAAKKGATAATDEQETTLGLASGGILEATRGGSLIRFAEAGMNEAGVPLPDGRRIPVDMPMGQLATSLGDVVNKFSSDQVGLLQQNSQNFEQALKLLTEKFDSLSQQLGSQNQTGGVMSDVANHLKEMKETAMKQLDIHGTMASLLGENKDISNSILNNSY